MVNKTATMAWLGNILVKINIIFRVTGHLWGESTGHCWIPLKRARDAELDVLFDLRLNKRLSK